MQVSIIIVNFNVQHFLHQCLSSVEAALKGMSGEIIVVDNASNDGSCEMILKRFPEVITICNKENVGFSKANNQGVARAKGKYILILNPDTVLSEDTLQKLFSFAEKNPKLGAISVPLFDGTGKFLPESKRNIPTPWVSLKKLLGKSKQYYVEHLSESESGKIDILAGAFMWMEKANYQEVGGFDEDYFMYGEDIDLSYKLLKKGFQNYFFAQTHVIHYKGESTQKDTKYLKNFYSAMRIFYIKHFKINVWIDYFMRGAILFWYGVTYLKMKWKKPVKYSSPGRILYVGSENDVYLMLQKIYKTEQIHLFAVCETRVISRYDDLEKIKTFIKENGIQEIVFDHQNNSFSKIIFYFTHLSSMNLTFKIHPTNAPFIIGSDDRTSKGKVLKFN